MLEIRTWVKILKALKTTDKEKEEVLKKNLHLFENLLYKIEKIRQEFDEKRNLSEYELEAYSRCISNISQRLVESWEGIVIFAINILRKNLEQVLERDANSLKKVKNILKCCKAVKMECKENDSIKTKYRSVCIEKCLFRIEELEIFIFNRYINKLL